MPFGPFQGGAFWEQMREGICQYTSMRTSQCELFRAVLPGIVRDAGLHMGLVDDEYVENLFN
eukprot:5325423-Amphidinium_carterae.1